MDEHIETVAQIRQKFKEPVNVNVVHHKQFTPLDKLALFITEHVGTMGFFFIILIWTILWLGWNMLAPVSLRFDPYPGFVLWLFISNMLQILLMPLIMVGQNIQGKHADLRSEYDYQTDRKSEHEIETILLRLEQQQSLMIDILKRINTLEEKKKS